MASVAPFFLVQPFRLSLVEFSSASREVNFFDFSFPSRRHFSCFIFSVFSLPAFKMLTFSQIRSAADFPPKAASVAPTNISLTEPWFETLVTPYSLRPSELCRYCGKFQSGSLLQLQANFDRSLLRSEFGSICLRVAAQAASASSCN